MTGETIIDTKAIKVTDCAARKNPAGVSRG